MQLGRIGSSYGVEVAAVDASFIDQALDRWANLEGYGTREIIRWAEDAVADAFIARKNEGVTRLEVAWADGGVVLEKAADQDND
jgi:hypothetical protein